MRGFNAGDDLAQDRDGALKIERAFAPQELIKTFAIDVFHHQKENAFGAFAKVGDVDDVWMANRGGGAGFAFETRDRFAFLQ